MTIRKYFSLYFEYTVISYHHRFEYKLNAVFNRPANKIESLKTLIEYDMNFNIIELLVVFEMN